MLIEYMKAVNNLTINEENRLKIKIQKLEVEKSRIDKLEENFRIRPNLYLNFFLFDFDSFKRFLACSIPVTGKLLESTSPI